MQKMVQNMKASAKRMSQKSMNICQIFMQTILKDIIKVVFNEKTILDKK